MKNVNQKESLTQATETPSATITTTEGSAIKVQTLAELKAEIEANKKKIEAFKEQEKAIKEQEKKLKEQEKAMKEAQEAEFFNHPSTKLVLNVRATNPELKAEGSKWLQIDDAEIMTLVVAYFAKKAMGATKAA